MRSCTCTCAIDPTGVKAEADAESKAVLGLQTLLAHGVLIGLKAFE